MALEARGLVVAHPGASALARTAAGPLDLTLAPGEWLGIVGKNGAGKTALLLTLAGLVPRRAGTLTVDGVDPASGGPRARVPLGIVFQEPETQFVSDRVTRELAFPLENLAWPRADVDARVEELLDAFALRDLAGAAPDQLSGGEMQRVALAAAAAPRPRYLLLDEPASHLDAPSRAELLRWTRAYVEREGAAVVWAECEASRLSAADRVLDLGGGAERSREPGATPEVASAGSASPQATSSPGSGIVRWRGTGLALRLDGGTGRASRTLWGGIDLDIRSGETWVVTGPNGRGKTALLETLAGWREPTAGRLERPAVSDLALVAQFPEYQLFAATAAEEVGFALRHRRGLDESGPGGTVRERVARALAWVGLDPAGDADRPPESLSLGERRRLAIAGVLIAEPVALLLDEPTAGLDAPARAQVLAALSEAARRGAAVVLATHDGELAGPLGASRIELPPPAA